MKHIIKYNKVINMLNDVNEIVIQKFRWIRGITAQGIQFKKIFSLYFTMFYVPKHATANINGAWTRGARYG